MSRSWIFGVNPDCDVVVDLPTVSGRHCRLTAGDDGYSLQDMGSTNGTYVNGARITGAVKVRRGDAITLGLTIPLPWPSEAADPERKVWTIGREPDNDFVFSLPTVSGHHARIVWDGATRQAYIEDLGSSNGTALGTPDRRITRAPLSAADTVYLGSHAVPASALFARIVPAPPRTGTVLIALPPAPSPALLPAPAPPFLFSVPNPSPTASGSDLAGECRRVLGQPGELVALLLQAPLLALLIVLTLSRAVAALVFALSLAALWFGLSDAIFGNFLAAKRARVAGRAGGLTGLAARALVLGALCVLQCVLTWAVVALGTGLHGLGLPALGVLVIAALVGLTFGLLIVSLVPRPGVALALLPLTMLLLGVLGGERWPLPRMTSAARALANAMPSRWAFEGVLLLASEWGPTPTDEGATRTDDLAERYFPADTERMGVSADALALGAMLLGLAGSAAFLAGNSRPNGERPLLPPPI